MEGYPLTSNLADTVRFARRIEPVEGRRANPPLGSTMNLPVMTGAASFEARSQIINVWLRVVIQTGACGEPAVEISANLRRLQKSTQEHRAQSLVLARAREHVHR